MVVVVRESMMRCVVAVSGRPEGVWCTSAAIDVILYVVKGQLTS